MARRIALEKKQQLRDATMAECGAAYKDMLQRKLRTCRQNAKISKQRNNQLLASLLEYQKQNFAPGAQLKFAGRTSAIALEKAKQAYSDQIEHVYPAWQEQMQEMKIHKLRQLEREKREIEYRRLLAKQSFEKEQALEILLQQTAQDITFAANVERNEAFERQLFRQQKAKEASELDYLIQMRAEEERRRLEGDHIRTLISSPMDQYESLTKKYTPFKLQTPESIAAEQEKLRLMHLRQEDGHSVSQEPAPAPPCYQPISHRDFEEGIESHVQKLRPHIIDSQPGKQFCDTPSLNRQIHSYPYERSATHQPDGANLVPAQRLELPLAHTSMALQEEPRVQDKVDYQLQPHIQLQDAFQKVSLETIANQPTLSGTQMSSPNGLTDSAIDIRTVSMKSSQIQQYQGDPTSNTNTPSIAQELINPSSAPRTPFMETQTAPFIILPSLSLDQSMPTANIITIAVDAQANAISKEVESRCGEAPDSILDDYYQMTALSTTNESPADNSLAVLTPPIPEHDGQVSSPLELSNAAAKASPTSQTPIQQPDMIVKVPSKPPSPVNTLLLETHEVVHENVTPSSQIDEILQPDEPKEVSPPKPSTDDNTLGKRDEPDEIDLSTPHNEKAYETKPSVGTELPSSSPIKLEGGPSSPDDTFQHLDTSINLDTTLRPEIPLMEPSVTAIDDNSHPSLSNGEPDSQSHTPSVLDNALSASNPAPIVSDMDMSLSVDESFEFSPPIQNPPHAEASNHPPDILILDSSMQSTTAESPKQSPPRMTSAFPPSTTSNTLDDFGEVDGQLDDDQLDDDGELAESYDGTTATFNLTVNERLSVLQALIPRIEECGKDGEQYSSSGIDAIGSKSKQDLIKIAMGGRKAQMGIFGGDVCLALLVDIAKDVGPYMFPERIFEGKMTEQKLMKEYKSCREKETEYWKAFSAHFKQLIEIRCMQSAEVIDLFTGIFLLHLNNDPRSTRKLREFLSTYLTGSSNVSKPPATAKAIDTETKAQETKQTKDKDQPQDNKLNEAKNVLNLAFMQRDTSPTKNKGAENVMRLGKSPKATGGIGQRVLQGLHFGDISEFDDDAIDYDRLIGTSSKTTKLVTKATPAIKKKSIPKDDDFDEDF